MKLTPRQKDFLSKFLELYREDGQPLHYAFVAKKLGIARVTAYEMLCALEKFGLVSREYSSRRGPGRSSVRFLPAPQAMDWRSLGKELEEVRSFLARIAEKAARSDPERLREEFLRELPENPSPFLFMAGLSAVTLSALIGALRKGQVAELRSLLRAMRLPGAITGFVAGLALAGGFSVEMLRRSLVEMGEEAHRALADLAGEFLQNLIPQEVGDESSEGDGGKDPADRPGNDSPGPGKGG